MKKFIIGLFFLIALSSCFNNSSENKLDFNKILENENNLSSKYGFVLYSDNFETNTGFNGDLKMCDDSNLFFCKLIERKYFNEKYYNKCLSLKDISKCDLLSGREGNDDLYCKGDFYLNKLFISKDKSVCDNFSSDFTYGNLMGSKKYNNKELCLKLYDDLISKDNLTETDIDNFSNEVSNDEYLSNTLKPILLSNFNNNEKIFSNLIGTEIRMGKIDCEKLADKDYLFSKLNGVKSIFNNKINAQSVYQKYAK